MGDGVSRPMTGIRGAGYPGTASGQRRPFDPLNQAAARNVSSPGLDAKREETPEEKIKNLERKVRFHEITYNNSSAVVSTQCKDLGCGILYILWVFYER